jgi:hypothetical protein
MTAEGVDRVVDEAAAFPITGIAFCVNVQRALFASRTWETFYSDYDPALGDEQPTIWRRHGGRNLWLLEQRGIDHHARWLARCRHHGIEGWLSMRMNDCHGLKEYTQGEEGEAPTHWTRHWASTWWREHPEYRRAPYRLERSWEGAFDFTHQAVRDHHMALIAEILERYDMVGLELDWMRWGMFFAPGKEQAGLALLTDFVREVRRLAAASARRVGHPVKISVRVPAEPQACMALGFDVPQWAEDGLVDMVILSCFLGGANFDYPIALWRRLLGPQVALLANVEGVVNPYPTIKAWTEDQRFTLGAAASVLQRGVDGIHLFNHCPSKLLQDTASTEGMKSLYRIVADRTTLTQHTRRHAVSYPQVFAPGETSRAVLPVPLTAPTIGTAFGRMEANITLRMSLGPKPVGGTVTLHLGLSADTPPVDPAEMTVRVNQTICRPGMEMPAVQPLPTHVARTLRYAVPLATLQDDVNVVEFVPPQVPGALVWAEMVVEPE